MKNYGVIIDRSMITNIFDTTPAESYALLSGQMIVAGFNRPAVYCPGVVD
jgi:glucan phosphoethanolaminetransferase (alkaline phosphatase superfamily)